MDVDRDGGQTISHHPQWAGPVPQGPPHGARPVPVPPGLHPPGPPAPGSSRQNGSQGGVISESSVGISPPNNYPTGATVSYREEGRVGGDGQTWPAPSPARSLDQAQGPVCTLPMPEFWCSIAYFELDTQVRSGTGLSSSTLITDNSARLVRYSKFPAPARLLLLTAMWTRVRATGSVWGP